MNHSMGFIIWKHELSWVPSKHCILDFGIKDTAGILGPEECRYDYKDPKQQAEDDCWFLSNFHCFFFKYYNWFVLPEKINNNLIFGALFRKNNFRTYLVLFQILHSLE